MNHFIKFIPVILCISVISCQPEAPLEEKIKNKIVGSYCAFGDNDYRLILTDSTYYSIRYTPGVLSEAKIRESCKGNYTLAFEGNQWVIRYQPDDDPNATIENCEAEYVIWDSKEGFLVGEEEVVMRELFDGAGVTQAACEP